MAAMGCGEHGSRGVKQVNHRQDQQVEHAASQEVSHGDVRRLEGEPQPGQAGEQVHFSLGRGRAQGRLFLGGALGYADFAVLMRTNEQMRVMADVFKKCGIPFQAANRRQLLKRRGIVELVSLLRLVAGMGGYADVARGAAVLAPTLGKNVTQAFQRWGLNNRLTVKDALPAALRFPITGLSRSRLGAQ